MNFWFIRPNLHSVKHCSLIIMKLCCEDHKFPNSFYISQIEKLLLYKVHSTRFLTEALKKGIEILPIDVVEKNYFDIGINSQFLCFLFYVKQNSLDRNVELKTFLTKCVRLSNNFTVMVKNQKTNDAVRPRGAKNCIF